MPLRSGISCHTQRTQPIRNSTSHCSLPRADLPEYPPHR
jgi:hypothetical protein